MTDAPQPPVARGMPARWVMTRDASHRGPLLPLGLWRTPPLPPHPHHPGRRSDGMWKAAAPSPRPAPSHTPWKSLRDSHSPPATATTGRAQQKGH